MRVQVNRDVFSEAVSFAAKLLLQRTALPIMSGVLLEAQGEELSVSSYDYETSGRETILAQVDEPGRVLVSARMLADIASKLPQAEVKLELVDNKVLVSAGSAKFSLATLPVEEYPSLPEISGSSGKVSAQNFAQAISQVVVAASRDDVTPVITGVLINSTGSKLEIIATDRYRVAIRTLDWESPSEEFTALIPAKSLQEIGRSFINSETVEIILSQTNDTSLIGFKDSHKTVTSALIKGNFPPVQRLFPETVEDYAIISTSELVEATKRVQTVLEKEAALKFNFETEQVTLEAAGSEHAQAQEAVACVLTGTEIVVSLKPQFLIDGLSASHSEFIKLAFTKTENPNKPGPVLITPHSGKNENETPEYRYLLQPNLLLR